MVEKSIREFYKFDTISNEKGWRRLLESLQDVDYDVLIDFTGVKVMNPVGIEEVKMILSKPNISLRFYDSSDMVNSMKAWAIVSGIDHNKIHNIDVVKPVEKTAAEKKVESGGKQLVKSFSIENIDGNSTYVINVAEKYTQMHSINTVNYLRYAIMYLIENGETKNFLIKLDNISILDNILHEVVKLCVDAEKSGGNIKVSTLSDEVSRKWPLYKHKVLSKNIDNRYKVEMFKQLPVGTPGFIIQYKKSRAMDEFGRYGGGQPIRNTIAIYRGLEYPGNSNRPGSVLCAKFDVFRLKTFYTSVHWAESHDEEILPELAKTTATIPIADVGLHNEFMGHKYHFTEPIPSDIKTRESVIIDRDDKGRPIKYLCTIPERMKFVFDDWEVSYNKEKLNEYIKRTCDNFGIKPVVDIE